MATKKKTAKKKTAKKATTKKKVAKKKVKPACSKAGHDTKAGKKYHVRSLGASKLASKKCKPRKKK